VPDLGDSPEGRATSLIGAATPTPMGAVSDKTCSSTRDETNIVELPEHWSSTPESNRPVWFNACALPCKWQHPQINAWTNEGMIHGFCFCYLRQFLEESFCRERDLPRSDFAVTGNRFPRSEWNRIS
jgi:hypothetical protein